MENLCLNTNNSINPTVKEFLIPNLRQLSNTLKKLSKENESKDQKFSLEIFSFKKITKMQCILLLYINGSPNKIIYEFLGASQESLKKLKKEFIGNFIEEILENFQPLQLLSFHSDNRNKAGLYTMKHLVNDCKNLKILDLENIFFSMDEKIKSNSNYIYNESISFYSNLKVLDSLENISLNFSDTLANENFMDIFHKLLNSIFSIKTLKVIKLKFFIDSEINFSQIFENGVAKFKYPFFQFDEIKMSFINTNLSRKNSFKQNEMLLASKYFFENFIPEFLELNFVEILNNKNSELDKKNRYLPVFKNNLY